MTPQDSWAFRDRERTRGNSMKRITILIVLAAAIALPFASEGTTNDVEALKATFEGAIAALNAGNLDGFLDTVHEDALSFYSCGPTSGKRGREACRLDWQLFFDGTRQARFDVHGPQYAVIGNTGVAWGEYRLVAESSPGEEFVYTGRYTMTYTKVGSEWRIVMQHNIPSS